MIYARYIIGTDASRRTNGTTASSSRRTRLIPLRTCTKALLSRLSREQSPFLTSENKKTAQPIRSFNGDWNCLWRPGRNDRNVLPFLNPELNCPIAITDPQLSNVLSTIGPNLSRENIGKFRLIFNNLTIQTKNNVL